MGCPDWPKCFGLWAPPTCACDLPADYKETFLKKRLAKLEKFAQVLERVGFKEKAQLLRTDKRLLVPEAFNTFKAWTEYINRLVGVLAGLFSLAFFIASFRYIRSNKPAFWWAAGALILLIFNAWLGSIVVAANLLPGLVSFHYLAAFVCFSMFVFALHAERPFKMEVRQFYFKKIWWTIFLLLAIEVILGTLSRERVEQLEWLGGRSDGRGWLDIEAMGWLFAVHRFASIGVLGLAVIGWWQLRILGEREQADRLSILAVLSVIQIGLGAFNIVMDLPVFAQTSHVVIGSLMPALMIIWLRSSKHSAEKKEHERQD